jgi:hypothetical protein
MVRVLPAVTRIAQRDLSAGPEVARMVNHALLKNDPYSKPIVAAVVVRFAQLEESACVGTVGVANGTDRDGGVDLDRASVQES